VGVETAAAVAIGGTALKVYGDYQSAQAQAEAAKKNAESKRIMAFDVLKRADYNINETQKQGELFSAQQIGAYVKSGVELEGSVLLALEDTAYKVSQNMINQQREADSKAKALFMGADIDTQLSGDIGRAAIYQGIGTTMSAAGSVAGNFTSKSAAPPEPDTKDKGK